MILNKKATWINWITAILWAWTLLTVWTDLHLPYILIPNTAIITFLILCLQTIAHCDVKNMFTLKDKEMMFVMVIATVTLICLVISKSGFGAFFTIINLCLLWYLSDKWMWDKKQIFLLGLVFVYIFISWFYKPMQLGENTNPNTTGTITIFSMLTLITFIEYMFPQKKCIYFIEFVMVCFSLYKLLIFHGRGSLVALLFYVALRLIALTNLRGKQKFYEILCYLLTLGSLLFVGIYTLVWKVTGINYVIPYWNKSIFSGRERIWYELWTYLQPRLLTGIGTNVTLQSWHEYNVHNAIYNILVTHGIIVFVLVLVYMLKKMFKLYCTYNASPIFMTAISGVLAIYMESFFDMDLLWFPQFLVWSFMLVILASSKQQTKGEPSC